MAQGRFTHEDITKAVPVAHEVTIAVTAHYAIGLVLGAGYALLLRVPQPQQSTLPAPPHTAQQRRCSRGF